MHLYMIRHGQSYVNLPDWPHGNTDEGLTDLGQQQAAALANWLPEHIPHIDALYASTMKRAKETAEPLAAAYGLDIQFDDRLREIGNNRYDHTPWPSDSLPNYGEFWGSERPFSSITPEQEGGESMMHFRVRIGMFIEELVEKHRSEVVVAVCHGGVIELTFDHIFNIGPFRRCEVWSKNTGIAYFEYVEHPQREMWRLHYHSRVEHLANLRKTAVIAKDARTK
ncbi:MAG: histidine phosphatase family protein [Candidatus Promineifilaceae bacterium]